MSYEGGYTLTFRRLWENPVFRSKQEAAVFAYMISAAAWKQTRISTKFGPVKLDAGDIIISERSLSCDFGLHKNTIRLLFERMIHDGTVLKKKDQPNKNCGTIYTIVKYKEYQNVNNEDKSSEDHLRTTFETTSGPPQDHLRTTLYIDKQVNQVKQVNEDLVLPLSEPDRLRKDTRKKPRIPIPENFPTSVEIEWAIEKGLDPLRVRIEAERIRNWAIGNATIKADWPATWRNWILDKLEGPKNAKSAYPSKPSSGSGWREFISEEIGRSDQESTIINLRPERF